MNVSAEDKATGREQKITITASSGLSDDEVERMVEEAEQFAAEDATRKDEIEVRNTADSVAYSADKFVSDYGDKLPDDAKSETEQMAQSLREALAGEDLDRISSESAALTQHIQGLGAQMYEQEEQEAQAASEEEGDFSSDDGGDTPDDVVEGEVVEP